MAADEAWGALTERVEEIETLEGISALLGWDQQTMLPSGGSAARGMQLALTSRLVHERLVDPALAELLQRVEASDPLRTASVRNLRRAVDRAVRVPARLVTELAQAQTAGFDAWVAAKQRSDFTAFAPHLSRLLDLTMERAQAIDPRRAALDVILEEYDPGTTVTSLRDMFGRLANELAALVRATGERPLAEVPPVPMDFSAQRRVHHRVLAALGFDFERGRLDDSEHPFSVGMHPTDVRITTHLYPDDVLGGLSSTIHECGHALYEQGLPSAWRGTYVGRAASYGLHESQSRFWENAIGRSLPFQRWLCRVIQEEVPGAPVEAEAFYRASNRVSPGLIRIHADEVTYNLHIIIRFELEVALFEGRLRVQDLPEAWNERYRELLGVVPPNDALGVLQDVHWSGAAFGYFPSYTLGNLYAASMGAVLEREQPELWSQVERGEFSPILEWLRARVHGLGYLQEAPDLVRAAVGDRDHVEDLVAYLWGRHGALYGLQRPARHT
jgi:carboxypeptidase Taq